MAQVVHVTTQECSTDIASECLAPLEKGSVTALEKHALHSTSNTLCEQTYCTAEIHYYSSCPKTANPSQAGTVFLCPSSLAPDT